jgi:cytochrome c oxidase subunit IV
MTDAHAEDVRKHVRIYITVFAALAVLTVVTVAASYLNLPMPMTVALALLIATIKGSLVACYFMHLISERKMIYATLLLTLVFFVVLMFLPLFSEMDQVKTSAPTHHVP